MCVVFTEYTSIGKKSRRRNFKSAAAAVTFGIVHVEGVRNWEG